MGLSTQNLHVHQIAFIPTRRATGTEELHSGPSTIIFSTDIWLMMTHRGTLKHSNSCCAWKPTLPPTLHSSRLEDQVATTGHPKLPLDHRQTLTAAEVTPLPRCLPLVHYSSTTTSSGRQTSSGVTSRLIGSATGTAWNSSCSTPARSHQGRRAHGGGPRELTSRPWLRYSPVCARRDGVGSRPACHRARSRWCSANKHP